MINVIIIAVIAVILIFAIRSSVRHFRGEGDCCGGGSDSIYPTEEKKEKKIGPVIGKKRLTISGMHCDHCAFNVTEAIDKIDGAAAKVDLNSGTAEVSYDRQVEDAILRQAVEDAGYTVTSIAAC